MPGSEAAVGRTRRQVVRVEVQRVVWMLLVGGLLVGCAPDRFDPVAWNPPAPSPEGEVDALVPTVVFRTLDGHGPETIIAGPEGWLFSGIKDGRILRFRPDGSAMSVFARTGGRPNGLAFDRHGNLLVADSYRGLLSINASGVVSVLATSAEGQAFVFPDGLDVASDGTIWLTDATARFPDGEFHYDILEGKSTGRLLTHDPVSDETIVRADGLRFPNGIALGPDETYILVNETLGYRTLRHWIKGPRAGTTEPFVEGYPGFPDDVRFNGDDLFWVALVADRMSIVDWVQPHPRLKGLLANTVGWAIPDSDHPLLQSHAYAIAIDTDGRVVHRRRAKSREFVGSTSVLEFEGQLFLGSISENGVAVAPVPAQPLRSEARSKKK